MACFTISAVEAIVVTAVSKAVEKKDASRNHSCETENRITFSKS